LSLILSKEYNASINLRALIHLSLTPQQLTELVMPFRGLGRSRCRTTFSGRLILRETKKIFGQHFVKLKTFEIHLKMEALKNKYQQH